MKELYKRAKEIEKYFEKVEYIHIPREQNKIADRLSNEAIVINIENHRHKSYDCCK